MSKDFFSPEQKEKITNAITEAELNTSGEIRVHIEEKCKEDVLDRASNVFGVLEMHKTELRNGVLFYLATTDRKFAILGDGGINEKVADDFWESTKDKMQEHFKAGDFATGLSEGILSAGEQLKSHFPYKDGDINELSNEISISNE